MTAPNLTSASFAKLYCGNNKTSDGTVTGTGIAQGNSVNIQGNGNKKWSGSVGTNVNGNTWNASVTRDRGTHPAPTEDTETVTVTVSSGGDTSNGVNTQSDVVPP
jgi:hypothetical protein